MSADLRITSLATSPTVPEAGESFFIQAECANVGDETSGPFVIRFVLDGSDSFDVAVDDLSPQGSTRADWPVDPGKHEGDHYVYCLADADHALAEAARQDNQRSISFTISEVQFGSSDAHGTEDYDEEELSKAVLNEIRLRNGKWLTLALDAVTSWEHTAREQIKAYNDDEASVDPTPVIRAFGEAVIGHLPGVGTGLGIAKDAAEIIGLVRSAMKPAPTGLAGARAKLEAAIAQIQDATREGIKAADKGSEGRLANYLAVTNPDSPLKQIQFASLRTEYIWQVVDDLGFPMPTTENTTQPIEQAMTEAFERVMEDVNRQLFKEIS